MALPATEATAPHGDCPVCCLKYTAKTRKPVNCPGCNYAACTVCVRTYLLGSLSDPACMNCGLYWCRSYLDATLTASWRNGPYRKHREYVLLDREHSLLPETQHLVQQEAERRARDELRRRCFEEYKQAQLIVREARNTWRLAVRDVQRNGNSSAGDNGDDDTSAVRRSFVAACPDAECRGFLSTQYKCGTCLKKYCSRCRELKVDNMEHECNPDTVETIALIAKVTKPCPNCAMSIERISGCDHMWCTSCDTGFSYLSGQRIANNRNTNPHMYERMRQLRAAAGADLLEDGQPEMPDDVRPETCGAHVHWPRANFSAYGDQESFLLSMHATGRHVEEELRRWPSLAADNATLRVQYCLKDFNKASFGARLQRHEKHRECLLEMRHVLESFLLMVYEFIMQMLTLAAPQASTCADRCNAFVANVEELINCPLQELSQRYGRATPKFVMNAAGSSDAQQSTRTYWGSRQRVAPVRQFYEAKGHVPQRMSRRSTAAGVGS